MRKGVYIFAILLLLLIQLLSIRTPAQSIRKEGSKEVVKEASKKSPDVAGQKGDSTPPGGAWAKLRSVAHDETLNGDGTTDLPLGVSIPLFLKGSSSDPILNIQNEEGDGIRAAGADRQGNNTRAGVGVTGRGGLGFGDDFVGTGGTGVIGVGGFGQSHANGGHGVIGVGGSSKNQSGDSTGTGVIGIGGDGRESEVGAFGGTGVKAEGGGASGAGRFAGTGIVAFPGFASNGAFAGRAGLFNGRVVINGGPLSVFGSLEVTGVKHFKIDHPLDPENKYLYHAAIESSEAINVYSGNVITDANGEAVVTLPDWFEALNKDFRYQLTPVGAPAQGLYISEKINRNRFRIAGGQPGLEVSWQVTGVRSDAVMRQHPFKTEEDKPEGERGTYLSPEAFGQPEERGIQWARDPELMKQLKQKRMDAEQKQKQQK